MIELLSPAPSPEAVTAAVQNGADAVYLSFDDLNDCRSAVNFSDDAFEAAVRYCRVRDCRVYLAMNVPIRSDEMQKAGGLAMRAQRAGVDAIIVRDLGLFAVLRRLLPEMPLFADHRMGFYTPESAKAAAALGFRRIFLPPEMPLAEIRRMAAEEIETAVFVQSSLCPAAAGTCRMSSMAGHGSADRGQCAELCRETYTLGGRWDTTPLSWKDRTLLGDIPALKEAGVSCAVIGSRERRVEYVAAYTAEARNALEDGQKPADADRDTMERVFAPYGVAKRRVYERAEPHEEEPRAVERYCAALRRSYSDTEIRRVGVRFAVVAQSGDKPITLGAQDYDGHQAVLRGPYPDPVGDTELTEESLKEIMYRTAGTPFRCEEVETALGEGLRVSGIELDEARRRLLYALSEQRAAVPAREEGLFPAEPFRSVPTVVPAINFSVQNAEQLTPELAALRPATLYVPLEVLWRHGDKLRPFLDEGCAVAAALPAVACGEEECGDLRRMLAEVRESGVAEALTGNLGLALIASQEGYELRGDLDLAVMNSYALRALGTAGFISAALSPELSLAQIAAMNKPIPAEAVIYGRLPAMISETCIIKESAGRCSCTTPAQMADTHGGVWPVTKDFGCRNTVWMAKKLWLEDLTDEWIRCGLWAVRLNFSTESPRECVDVAEAYIHGAAYRPNGMTRGAYLRGVE